MVLAAILAGTGLILALTRADRSGCLETESDPDQISRRLDEDLREALALSAAKKVVIRKLLAGRLGLREAAAHFRVLDHRHPGFYWDGFRDSYPGNSDEERHCREVIGWLVNADDDCLALATAARCESELNALLKGWPICLPTIDSGRSHGACSSAD
jgi:hypothetical protein